MKFLFSRLILVAAASIGAAWASGHDAVIESCNSCHGDGGVSQSNDAPTIAGLSEFYHGDQLYFYRDGDRTCADAGPESMCAAAADLADELVVTEGPEVAIAPHGLADVAEGLEPVDQFLAHVGVLGEDRFDLERLGEVAARIGPELSELREGGGAG